MFADEFSNLWIEQDERCPDITNSASTPVVVQIEGFAPMQITNVHTEYHEDADSKTIWITAEEM